MGFLRKLKLVQILKMGYINIQLIIYGKKNKMINEYNQMHTKLCHLSCQLFLIR